MPGIAGIIGVASGRERRLAIDRMLGRMSHESWYGRGAAHFDNMNLSAGWVVDPGSFSDCMPVWNEERNICLIYTGDDFPDDSEVRNVKKLGDKSGGAKANYLIHRYEEKGLDFLPHLNGWFSGIIIDLRCNKAFLFNDRYGLNRVYYHQAPEGLYFASEAKSLLAVLPELRRLDEIGLAELVVCGCVLQNRTLFRGVTTLPGGSVWTAFKDGLISPGKYFEPKTWESQPLLNAREYYSALRDTFPKIQSRYFRGAQRIGMSLTGGLDGRMIMAWARHNNGSLPCYTFGGMFRDCADVKIARRVARSCGQTHSIVRVGESFLREFPTLASKTVFVSDGSMDVSGAVELYVNRLAREIAPIRLTGNYGSEILRRNVAFRPKVEIGTAFSNDFSRLFTQAADVYRAEAEVHKLSFIAFKQVPWHHHSRFSVERSQISIRSPYLDNDLVGLVYRAPADCVSSPTVALRLIADGNQSLSQLATDRGLMLDPNRFANGGVRLLQETAVKAEYAYDYGMPSWLAAIDRVFGSFHLERLFLGRHKFYHFRVWYRDQLAAYVRDVLLDPRSLARSYVSKPHVERMVNEHVGGFRNHTLEIHKLLSAELAQRHLIEQS